MPGAADLAGRRDDPDRPPDQAPDHSPGRLQQRLDNLPDGHPSSPRNEDGSLRAPAVSLKDLELPDAYTPIETEAPPDTEDQPPSDATSDTWRKEVPGFKTAWEGHLERWPETDHPPAGGFDDQTGLWRSEAGLPLTKEQLADTDKILDQVKEVEFRVTRMMKSVETAVPGATLVGLDNRLKGEDRFREKVAYEKALEPDEQVSEIIDRIPDKIRYTYQLNPERYTDGYWDSHTQLTHQGNELVRCKNAWEDQEYKGINTRWLSTEGQIFEVQFHTPSSFEAKQLTHPAYERIRTRGGLGAELPQLEDFQRAVTSRVEIPDRAETIPDYHKEGY
jgi:hypothetical protein